MVELNVKALMQATGVRYPTAVARKLGIGQRIMSKLVRNKQQTLQLSHIEKLCTLLRCTPNDLFAWTPDQPADDYPENPLQVIRKKDLPKLDEVVGKMSLEEVRRRLGDEK